MPVGARMVGFLHLFAFFATLHDPILQSGHLYHRDDTALANESGQELRSVADGRVGASWYETCGQRWWMG